MKYLVSRLYIGADNETHELDTDKIARLVSEKFQGFTLTTGQGFYNGTPEQCAIVTVAQAELDKYHRKEYPEGLKGIIKKFAAKLAEDLDQECIMVESTWSDVE